MNKDNWEYWVINSYSDRAFLAHRDPGLEGWGVMLLDKNACKNNLL